MNDLIERGADVNAWTEKPAAEHGRHMMHLALDKESVETLIKAGAQIDPEYRGDAHSAFMKGETPLHSRILQKDWAAVDALVAAGADVNRPFGKEFEYSKYSLVAMENRVTRGEALPAERIESRRLEVAAETAEISKLFEGIGEPDRLPVADVQELDATTADRLQSEPTPGLPVAEARELSPLESVADAMRGEEAQTQALGTTGQVEADDFGIDIDSDNEPLFSVDELDAPSARVSKKPGARGEPGDRIEPYIELDAINSIEPVISIDGGDGRGAVVDAGPSAAENIEAALKDMGVSAKSVAPQAVAEEAAPIALGRQAAARVEEAEASIKRMFHVTGNEYHFKDKADPKLSLAFVDKSSRLATEHNDPVVIDGMLKVAETKGWSTINLKGSEDFKREAWIQASARGFEVTGYKPTEIDKVRMQEERDRRAANHIHDTAKSGGSMEAGQGKTTGGMTPEVEAYSKSKEFAEVSAKVAEDLKKAGYPVNDEFKQKIGEHLLQEFAAGRKIEKGIERATPAPRVVEPTQPIHTRKDLELTGPSR